MKNFPIHLNTVKKEKELNLSLFRISLQFFSDDFIEHEIKQKDTTSSTISQKTATKINLDIKVSHDSEKQVTESISGESSPENSDNQGIENSDKEQSTENPDTKSSDNPDAQSPDNSDKEVPTTPDNSTPKAPETQDVNQPNQVTPTDSNTPTNNTAPNQPNVSPKSPSGNKNPKGDKGSTDAEPSNNKEASTPQNPADNKNEGTPNTEEKPSNEKNNPNSDNKKPGIKDNPKDDDNKKADKGNEKNGKENKKAGNKNDNPTKSSNNNSLDKARNMQKKTDKPSVPASDKSPIKNNAMGGMNKVKQAQNLAKDFANGDKDVADVAGEVATEAAKKAVGAVASPAAEKALDVADKVLGSTEVGKKVKKGVGYCAIFGCCSSAFLALLPIFIVVGVLGSIWSWIFGSGEPDEYTGPSIIDAINEEVLAGPSVNLLQILDDAIEEGTTGSKKDPFPEAYEVGCGNYTVDMLKRANPDSYISNVHLPLVEKILKDSEREKLKKFFDSQVPDSFFNDLASLLSKETEFYNPYTNSKETASLYDLFIETSSTTNDALYPYTTVNAILSYSANQELINDFYLLQEYCEKTEIMTYMRTYQRFYWKEKQIQDYMEDNKCINASSYDKEFFDNFLVINDISTYMALSGLTRKPGFAYDVAIASIDVLDEWIMPIYDTYEEGKTFAYMEEINTWYATYHFKASLNGTADNASFVVICDNVILTGLSDTLFKRYNLLPADEWLSLFSEIRGIDYTDQTVYGKDKRNMFSSPDILKNTIVVNYPVSGGSRDITLGFGERYSNSTVASLDLSSSTHKGIDFGVPSGTSVQAISSGVVASANYGNSGYGNYVTITHPSGYTSIYAHGNGTFYVTPGQTVQAGQPIMQSGNSGNSTGPHLHLEVRNSSSTPIDPMSFMRAEVG